MVLVEVASVNDLSSEQMRGVKAGNQAVLLVNLKGNYYAIRNVCTHAGCLLSDGDLNGEIVQCECHGSRFNVKTGEVVGGPAKKPEQTFKVQIEKDKIMLDI